MTSKKTKTEQTFSAAEIIALSWRNANIQFAYEFSPDFEAKYRKFSLKYSCILFFNYLLR